MRLKRLSRESYQGHAIIHWIHTIKDRKNGWLSDTFHASFRELLLHTQIRYKLICPIYTLMPDHIHLIWIGTNTNSCQRNANKFLKTYIRPLISPIEFQDQSYDHILRDEELEQEAFTTTLYYIANNPVRKGIISEPSKYSYTASLFPGYPNINFFNNDFFQKMWKILAIEQSKQ